MKGRAFHDREFLPDDLDDVVHIVVIGADDDDGGFVALGGFLQHCSGCFIKDGVENRIQ